MTGSLTLLNNRPPAAVTPDNSSPVISSPSQADISEYFVEIFYTGEVSDLDNNPISKLEMLDTLGAAYFIFNPNKWGLMPLASFDFETLNDVNAPVNIFQV